MTRILIILNAMSWSFLAISGISGYFNIVDQKISGYPNSSQTLVYIVFPLTMVSSIAIAMTVFKDKGQKWAHAVITSWLILALVMILPYTIISRGGV